MTYTHEQFASDFTVSHETLEKLQAFEAILRHWQAIPTNLVSATTLPDLWRRHFADSAQLLALAPNFKTWADLGSGAGFPGLVIAILSANHHDRCVHLVESNGRKCAFLSEAVRETGVNVTIHNVRIEDAADQIGPVDVVSARALAPLVKLLGLARPFICKGALGVFPKGRDAAQEIAEAQKRWKFRWKTTPSRTDSQGQIIEICELSRK
jgi:16S rRNA (guanine527-N7)-methyltransferase